MYPRLIVGRGINQDSNRCATACRGGDDAAPQRKTATPAGIAVLIDRRLLEASY
jgi:hypothetical protein